MSQHANHLCQLLEHKKWMDAGLYKWIADGDYQARPELVRKALYWLNHIYLVDQIFQAHLIGRPHSIRTTVSDDFPPLAELSAAALALDQWLIEFAADLSEKDAGERIIFKFTDGDYGCMTRAEMLMHLVLHGQHHHSVTGHELTQAQMTVPPLLLSSRLTQIFKSRGVLL